MPVTYQDVVRANGALGSWAFPEAAGLTFAPWLGGLSLVGSGGIFLYQQAGPFAGSFAVGLPVGGKLDAALSAPLMLPWTFEAWVNVPALPGANQLLLYYNGNAGANGLGFGVHSVSGKLEFYYPAVGDLFTQTVLTTGAWHLIQVSFPSASPTVYLDGQPVWTGALGNTAANPVDLYFGGNSGSGATAAFLLAYPAIYGYALSPSEAYASFLASTDPDSAIAYTSRGTPAASLSDSALLAEIYAAVHKTW